MKSMLFVVGAITALTVAPAWAEPERQNFSDEAAHQRAYDTGSFTPPRQCFNGEKIKGVSRSGERSLLVQTTRGAIYDVTLGDGCAAADHASKLTAVSGRSAAICVDDTAVLFARTADGVKRCKIADVRPLSSNAGGLSPTPRR
jgi:hypothetical protein